MECASTTKKIENAAESLLLVLNTYMRDFEGKWISHVLGTPMRLQAGFNCGLVALRMGAEFICPESVHMYPTLLPLAKELGLTNEGEIFSSYHLGILAEQHYRLKAVVLSPFTSKDVVSHLARGYPLLLPYDADKSYAPCVMYGNRPHWAIVRGFVFRTDMHPSFAPLEIFSDADMEDELFSHTKQPSFPLPEPLHYNEDELYLICQHGKSKNPALWSYTSIQQSNNNLQLPNQQKKESGRWKIPDSLSELQNHIILLYPPDHPPQ